MTTKKRVQFNVRLDGRGELVSAVRQRAAELKVALGDFVAMALENALEAGLSPRADYPETSKLEDKLEDIWSEIAKTNQKIASLSERLGK